MSRLFRILSFGGLLTVIFSAAAAGQDKKLETIAPAMVEAGQTFNVEYRIAANPRRIAHPTFTGMVLIGQASYTSMAGSPGNMQAVTVFSYSLVAPEAGKFTIPAASVVVDGETYTSQPRPIEVVGTGTAPRGEQPAEARPDAATQGGQATERGGDLFLRAVPDKTTAYRGEPVRVRFKLYSRVGGLGNEGGGKIPAFNGFWQQSIDVSNYEEQAESYNGNVYTTYIVAEYLLYPTQSGKLTIDPLTMNMIVREVLRRPSRSIWDDLNGGFPEVRETKRPVSSQAVAITVKDLPADAPEGFSGAVGAFTMTSDVTQGAMPVNSAATYKIKITGTGNIPLIQAPKMEMPASFEVHNSKMSEDTRVTQAGIAGSRTFEYPFIARAEGDYRIEPVPFSFFNPRTGEYVTLNTQEVELNVAADTTGGPTSSLNPVGVLSKEELRILGRDIRFIKHGAHNLKPKGTVLMCSAAWFAVAGALVAVATFMFFFLQRRIRQMRDEALVKGRKANKVVLARLKVADEHMGHGNQRRFHDEMLKALWGYMSDKLNIPAANLTKENVREELLKRGIPAEPINRYIDLISECEYAQYSPAESSPMQDKYKTAVEVISKFESYIKR